ncbi:MAG: lytic transglycosylase domain-containing protein [Ignavibacteriaceae bacterium]|jgi:membrane-bound lytic murein transglycosylase D|nr:lytic transglycosylase domain-containing protein [Ignavibacteriaceae bacterium]
MKTNRSGIYFFLLGVLGAVSLIVVAVIFLLNNELITASESSDEDFPQGYKITSPEIPTYLEFAGEKIPTENFEVFERMDREFISNTYFHSATILALKRAARWFPVIEPILKKNNIPDDFKYLCVAESNMENVISYAGATGFWQFMEPAGKKYGLEINSLIDERYDVWKSTEAACKYLKDSYEMFGSWTLSAASYNMGQDGVTLQMERQKANDYFNLVLNSETLRFVARIVAIKYILQNPEVYGFEIKDDEKYKPLEYYEVKLDNSISDFADYADSLGINYFILKMYNPWLRDNYLSNKSKQVYMIKLPKEGSIEIIKD